jgi:hypothetical protein
MRFVSGIRALPEVLPLVHSESKAAISLSLDLIFARYNRSWRAGDGRQVAAAVIGKPVIEKREL